MKKSIHEVIKSYWIIINHNKTSAICRLFYPTNYCSCYQHIYYNVDIADMQHTMFVMTLSFNNGEKNTSQVNLIFFDYIKFAETWTSTKVQNCTCFIQLIVISLLFCFVTKMKMYFYFYDCKMNVMADCKSIKLHSRHLRVI